MKRTILSLLAALTFGFAAQAAGPEDGKAFIDGLATQVLSIVKGDADKAAKQTKIEALFTDKVDINFVAKFVLGKNWRTATPQQQQDYIAAYKPFILKNYASKLTKYSGQTYTLKGAHDEDDSTVVTMVINDPNGQDVNVDYRLHREGSSFKIVDIVVEGVSLLNTQRSEFGGIVENKGVDGLIAALKAQVAAKTAN